MTSLLSSLPCSSYSDCLSFLSQYQSPYTKGWLLADIRLAFLFIIGYLVCIPLLLFYMKNVRNNRPFSVNWLILLHNFNLFLMSIYMSYRIFTSAWFLNDYSLFGNAVHPPTSSYRLAAEDLAFMMWINAVSKIIEFLDTAIMILKCNYHQLSFLHIYHHTTVVFIWWCILHFSPGGEAYFVAGTNAAIHVVMYAYYFMSNLYSTWKKEREEKGEKGKEGMGMRIISCHMVIKPYITLMQMIQFVSFITQGIVDLFFLEPFDFPRWLLWMIFVYPITLLALFGNFYLNAYRGKGKGKGKGKGEKGEKEGREMNGNGNGHSNGHSNGDSNGYGIAEGVRQRRLSKQH